MTFGGSAYVVSFDDEKGDLKLLDSFERNFASDELPQDDTVGPNIALLVGRFAFDDP